MKYVMKSLIQTIGIALAIAVFGSVAIAQENITRFVRFEQGLGLADAN